MIDEPIAKISMAAAATSLAILISGLISLVIASLVDSNAVFIVSITNPTVISRKIINHS